MQFGTYLHSKLPRIKCESHGVKTMPLPWAAKHSGFTLLFEAFAIRVLQASRSTQAASELITGSLDLKQREMVCGVCIDMSAPYIAAIREHFHHADIIHDKFQISQHLGNAVDKTRRIEHAMLQKQGDQPLTKTKYLWLKGMEHLSDEALCRIKMLGRSEFEVSKAWDLKELFKHFWSRRDKDYAEHYFEYWEKKVASSGVEEMKKVTRMLRKHLENILTYFDCYLTNAFSEGINSKIQAIKANARGFRNFKNYRTRILFFCGKLSLVPQNLTKNQKINSQFFVEKNKVDTLLDLKRYHETYSRFRAELTRMK